METFKVTEVPEEIQLQRVNYHMERSYTRLSEVVNNSKAG